MYEIMILMTLFQEFDHGQTISQLLPENWDHSIQPGGCILWECGQYYGDVEVVGFEGEGSNKRVLLRRLT